MIFRDIVCEVIDELREWADCDHPTLAAVFGRLADRLQQALDVGIVEETT